MAASSVATQSAQRGASQSACSTRRHDGSMRSQWLCQCSGPEFEKPGRISVIRFGMLQDGEYVTRRSLNVSPK